MRNTAIYVRQSVDKKDSISIENQISICQYELKGTAAEVYIDKGFSGKSTDRPQFRKLVHDIEARKITRVVVYKLDRISRSILDFANMMEMFSEYNVEFVSSTEKFDTTTPMGRAMLNICIVFAQLERETIQQRVADSYQSCIRRGMRVGGCTPRGYKLESFSVGDITTKRLVADPKIAKQINLIFELYAEPDASLRSIVRYFSENKLLLAGKPLFAPTLSKMLRNPTYVQADQDVYEFFKNTGIQVEGDAADFSGLSGCMFYRTPDGIRVLIPSPHVGIIPSELWLTVQRKLWANPSYPPTGAKAKTWLAGQVKCGLCGYSLIDLQNHKFRYMRCRNQMESKHCNGCGTVRTHELEQMIHKRILEQLEKLGLLSNFKGVASKRSWNKMSLDQKHYVIDILITQIRATGERVEIEWRH